MSRLKLTYFGIVQKPELLAIETQIEHATRKIASTKKLIESVEKDENRQSTTVNNLKRDLKLAEEAAEKAAGKFPKPAA